MDATAQQKQVALALALARFAATSTAVVVAAAHRGKPIEDRDVQHLIKLLGTCAATAPDEAKWLFDTLAETVAGKQYG